VIALLAFTYNAFEFASLAEVSEIQATSFGKSLLETISLSLEQKGNIDEVATLLNDLQYKLNQDQAKDDAWWKKENARLKAKIARLTKEIEALRREILRLLAEKSKYEKLRDQAAKNLVQYKKQKAHNHKVLDNNNKRRAADAADFKRSQSEHADVLNAIDAVVKELRRLIGSVSGAGVPGHVRLGDEEKRDLASGIKHAFMQITQDEAEVQAFIELATQVDQRALVHLIEALKKIKASTQKSYNNDVAHEKRSVQAYQHLKEILESDNRKLTSMIIQETKNHKLYVQRVAELIVKIAQTRKLRKAKIAEKNATIKERLAKKRRYLADKAQREEERRVIHRIDVIVKQRLENMSNFLKERVD
jgi:hypothetical protein